jgi:hypothetical protein
MKSYRTPIQILGRESSGDAPNEWKRHSVVELLIKITTGWYVLRSRHAFSTIKKVTVYCGLMTPRYLAIEIFVNIEKR